MRRTLLLVLALPAALLATAITPAPDVAPATATPPPAIALPSDTSDGALAVEPPGPSIGPPETAPETVRDAAQDPSSPSLRSAEGFLVAPGGAVSGSGPRWRYTVEVEAATGLDLEQVALQVASALEDPRSWVRTRTLERVDDPTTARIRLLIATPDTVDRLCAQVGLRTNGIFSCWNGRFAALNAWRWEAGASGFEDLDTYRTYLVNHEFGHGLGYGHVGCPALGAPAPVMMQQSKGLDGCIPNGWPYP